MQKWVDDCINQKASLSSELIFENCQEDGIKLWLAMDNTLKNIFVTIFARINARKKSSSIDELIQIARYLRNLRNCWSAPLMLFLPAAQILIKECLQSPPLKRRNQYHGTLFNLEHHLRNLLGALDTLQPPFSSSESGKSTQNQTFSPNKNTAQLERSV